MRSRLFLLGILYVLLPGIFTCFVHGVELDDVVGIWLFDERDGEVAKDSSGNGHNGEVRLDVMWEKEGRFGSALEFPGRITDFSYVKIPHSDALDLAEHSITAWINVIETAGDWQVLVGKWEPHDVRNYSLLTNKDTGIAFAQFTIGAGQYKTAMGQTVVTDGEWHHIACTYDGAIQKIYVDGVMEGQIAAAEPDIVPGDLTIGARWAGTHPTTGVIDDVGLFKVALDEDEISEIMNEGLGATFGFMSVELSDRLTATWGEIKTK